MVELKFCGLTRAEDAAAAAELGASYAGAVFAGGPRRVDVPRAQRMFAGLEGAPVRRVGVFGAIAVEALLAIADDCELDVLQLHDGGSTDRILLLRKGFRGAIWAVRRVTGGAVEVAEPGLLEGVDALVLDTAVEGRAGGTGVAFDWAAAAPAVRALQVARPVVLAGGLRPGNVAEAVRRLAPRAVDVSSGVESAPGIKDHGLMRAFADAARLREE